MKRYEEGQSLLRFDENPDHNFIKSKRKGKTKTIPMYIIKKEDINSIFFSKRDLARVLTLKTRLLETKCRGLSKNHCLNCV